MGSKIITKELKHRLLSEVTDEARRKFPGLNKMFSIYQYNLLVKKIISVKGETKLNQDLRLSQLIVDAIEYYWKEGKN